MLPALTIYTATYNRAKLLERVYRSLLAQTRKDFLWLVIDDGSTDNTRELVQGWMKENENGFEIQYAYKENGGVHTARNLAHHLCKTELFVSVDSDDWITDDAVEVWIKCWEKRGNKAYSGIITSVENECGARMVEAFPAMTEVSLQDFVYKYKCLGERHTVVSTSVIRQIQDFPVFPGERLVPETYQWIQFPEDKPFLLLDKVTRIYEQQEDGYIKGVALSRFKNPNGFRAACRQHIISAKYLWPRIKGHLGYIAFSLIIADKRFIKDSPKPAITALLTPFGLMVYWRFLLQKHRAEKERA